MQSAFNVFAASGDQCEGDECHVDYPVVAKKYIYWMAGMQFVNAVLPGVYYGVLRRWSWWGFKGDKYDDDFALLSTDAKAKTRVPNSTVRRGDDDDDDDGWYGSILSRAWAWMAITYMHAGIWGTGFTLFLLSFIQSLKPWYRFYIEHILSNTNYLAYLTGIILLALVAPKSGLQGWVDLSIYALLFAGLVYFVELIMGVRSLQALDHMYPWDDKLLLPSLFYVFGMEHKPRKATSEKKEEEADPFGFENDPSADADIPIDNFFMDF